MITPILPTIPPGRLKVECGPLNCWLVFVPDKPGPQIHIAQATVNDSIRLDFLEVIAHRFNQNHEHTKNQVPVSPVQ